MKKRDYLLSGVLLILIGVLLGLILSLFRSNGWPLDLAEVKVTEVKRSDTPLWDNSDLEKMDARFLFKTIAKNVKPAVVYIELSFLSITGRLLSLMRERSRTSSGIDFCRHVQELLVQVLSFLRMDTF